jgi:hypothetical protein
VAPGLRLVAESLLGADSPIDFVGVDAEGRTVIVLVGNPGGDLELVARGLAQRAWVQPRLRDWLQLAPHLGVRPEAGVRLLLLSTGFRAESRAAAAALAPGAPELILYRCVRNGAGVDALLEPLEIAPAAPAPTAPFRTGLTDADLGISPEERREFD